MYLHQNFHVERGHHGEAEPEYSDTAQDYYRRIYFEVIDVLVASIQERFNQRGYQMLQKLETILIETNPKSELVHLWIWPQPRPFASSVSFAAQYQRRWINWWLQLSYFVPEGVEREYYSEVIKVAKLILVMPATNALSERSFSALRRVKTWLRTTIDQVRLNHCMTLHVHKSRTDSLSLIQIGNEFIQRNTSRMHIFGQYEYDQQK